jgi:uncharacterized Zn-binding protein involved in type VI secretion
MGKPGANISTVTAHGGIVTIGAPTVLLETKPGSRIGDMHTCPMSDGPKPHVGGPILLGSFTVLTCGVPQSYQGMPAICVGPPDTLQVGATTVHVGMKLGFGAFALILGGLMAGLANFLSGYPRAVMLPDGTIVTQYNEHITITGDSEFQAKVVRDLNMIAATQSGQALLASLESSGKHTTIRPTNAQVPNAAAWTDPAPTGGGPYDGYDPSANGTGNPTDGQVWYDPDEHGISHPPYNTQPWGTPEGFPPDVTLFHELVHCDDVQHGRLDSNTTPPNAAPNMENRAVGLPPYDSYPPHYSENSYRDERGLPQRTFY